MAPHPATPIGRRSRSALPVPRTIQDIERSLHSAPPRRRSGGTARRSRTWASGEGGTRRCAGCCLVDRWEIDDSLARRTAELVFFPHAAVAVVGAEISALTYQARSSASRISRTSGLSGPAGTDADGGRSTLIATRRVQALVVAVEDLAHSCRLALTRHVRHPLVADTHATSTEWTPT